MLFFKQCGLICWDATHARSSVHLACECDPSTCLMVVQWDNIWKMCMSASKCIRFGMIQYISTDKHRLRLIRRTSQTSLCSAVGIQTHCCINFRKWPQVIKPV